MTTTSERPLSPGELKWEASRTTTLARKCALSIAQEYEQRALRLRDLATQLETHHEAETVPAPSVNALTDDISAEFDADVRSEPPSLLALAFERLNDLQNEWLTLSRHANHTKP